MAQSVALLVVSLMLLVMSIVIYIQGRIIRSLKEQVSTDPLTGLLNRRAFLVALERLVDLLPVQDEHRHYSLHSLAVFFIDLDYFKKINDTYGHAVGDEVLRVVALALQKKLRESDLVCRWGGEEIVVALPNLHTEEAVVVAEKIRQTIAGLTFSEAGLQITASIGISATLHYVAMAQLIATADKAVYEAKSRGRNQVVIA